MKLLLDTHVFLWWLRDDPKLGPRTRACIAAPQARLLLSVASLWELSIKHRLGRFSQAGSRLFDEARRNGIEVLAVRAAHLAALEALQGLPGHNDPFDHLIISQAIAEQALLVTHDRQMRCYDVPILGRA